MDLNFVVRESNAPAPRQTRVRTAAMPPTAGSIEHRRGSVLVLVIGVLALLALLVVVYTTVGQSDVRAGRSALTTSRIGEVNTQVARYISGVIGDNASAVYVQRDSATQQARVYRQSWDYPLTDPAAVSVNTGLPANEWNARRFNPSGTQKYQWQGNGADPRISADPFLASSEPDWLRTSTQPVGNLQDLVQQYTDWAHLSVISPDGRRVNLASLRNNWFAQSGLTTYTAPDGVLRPGTSSELYITERPASFGAAPGTVAVSNTDANSPAFWATGGKGLYSPVRLNQPGVVAGDPRSLPNMYADADGDGFFDSAWQELVDASDPNAIKNVLGTDGPWRWFVAPRIIDLSGRVNVNTASSFSDPFAGLVPAGGLSPRHSELTLDPYLPVATQALRGAPVRHRYTDESRVSALDVGVVIPQNLPVNSRAVNVDGTIGATPGDVDLERLLTGVDLYRSWPRSNFDYFGPVPSDAYTLLVGQQNFADGALEMARAGGAGFSGLITQRTLGISRGLAGKLRLNGLVFDSFEPGRLLMAPLSASGDFGPADINVAQDGGLVQHQRFVSSRDRSGMYYRMATSGLQIADESTTIFGAQVARVNVVTPATTADLRDLLTYRGANDASSSSVLESAIDGRDQAGLTTGRLIGPLRSDRDALADRGADNWSAPVIESRMLQLATDVRKHLTTVSGARPLTMASRPLRNGASATEQLPEFPITQADVRLDLGATLDLALVAGRVSAAQQLFMTYAEGLLPLADRHTLSGSGYNLWLEAGGAQAQRARISVTQYGGGVFHKDSRSDDLSPTGNLAAERLVPAANTEFALRSAAHLTLNLLSWRDPTGRPMGATLLLNEDERDDMPFAQGPGNNGRKIGTTDVPAYPYWNTSDTLFRTGAVRALALDFSDKPDVFDLDNDGNTSERAAPRLNDDSNAPPSFRPRAVNLLAARPQPVVTQVNSFVLYVDGQPRSATITDSLRNQIRSLASAAGARSATVSVNVLQDSDVSNTEGLSISMDADTTTSDASTVVDALTSQLESNVLEAPNNQFEIIQITVRDPVNGNERETLTGRIKINTKMARDNRDFGLEMVAVQITNPFDVPIPLSGEYLRDQPANGPSQQRARAGDALRTTDDVKDWNFTYYIELGGRYYRLLGRSFTDPFGNTGRELVTLAPRESRTFYILGQTPEEIMSRLVDADTGISGASPGANLTLLRQWIEGQLSQYARSGDSGLVLDSDRASRPALLVPFNPVTGETVSRFEVESNGIGVLFPQGPTLVNASIGAQPAPWMRPVEERTLANRQVRLWRAVRAELGDQGQSGRFSEITANGTSVNTGDPNSTPAPENRLENDQLVDVLRDPNNLPHAPGSLDRRLKMDVRSTDSGELNQRLGGDHIRIAIDSSTQRDSSGQQGLDASKGQAFVVVGGFRRPDDPLGGPLPEGQRVSVVDVDAGGVITERVVEFPRGAMPAWMLERKAPMATDGTSSVPSWDPAGDYRSLNVNRGLILPAIRDGASSGQVWTRSSGAFNSSNGGPQVLDTAGTSEFSREIFDDEDSVLAGRPVLGARNTQILLDRGQVPTGTPNAVSRLIVPTIAVHPALKGLVRPVDDALQVSPSAATASLNADQVRKMRATRIDYSWMDRPEQASQPAGVVPGNFAGRSFGALYSTLPTYPRSQARFHNPQAPGGVQATNPALSTFNPNPNAVAERPELPALRVTDVLLPWAIGPSWQPEQVPDPLANSGRDDVSESLDTQWITLGEAMALSFDFALPTSPVPASTPVALVDSPYFNAGVTLDRGRLRLDTPAPFSEQSAQGFFAVELGNLQPEDQPIDRGIPLGMALLDRFRALPVGGLTESTPGLINVGTAPKAVLATLPLVAANDADTVINVPRNWMTWGADRASGGLSIFNDGPYSSFAQDLTRTLPVQNPGLGEAPAPEGHPRLGTSTADLLALERARLRNRDETVWDLSATIQAYRDKLVVETLPSRTGASLLVDFAPGNSPGFADTGERRFMTGIRGLREEPGIRSVGELLALRLTDAPPGNNATRVDLRGQTQNNAWTNDGFDPDRDLSWPAMLSIDRFGRDKQPGDYAVNRFEPNNNGDPRRWERHLPLALSSVAYPRTLSAAIQREVQPGDVAILNSNQQAATLVDKSSLSNLVPSGAVDDYEQQLTVASALLNTVSVRSDIFAAYFLLHGYTQDDVAGLTPVGTGSDAGLSTEAPLVPSVVRRFVMVVDRSNCLRPGDQPRILMLEELPPN